VEPLEQHGGCVLEGGDRVTIGERDDGRRGNAALGQDPDQRGLVVDVFADPRVVVVAGDQELLERLGVFVGYRSRASRIRPLAPVHSSAQKGHFVN
jgi:hypothetical protein